MDFVRSIEHIYPDIVVGDHYKLQDDGFGVYIAEWNYHKQQPTQEELEQAWEQIKNVPPPEPPPTLEERIAELEAWRRSLENA